jgi:hypothetical protein
MGVYAETHVEIQVKKKKNAEKVVDVLKAMKPDDDGNTWLFNIDMSGHFDDYTIYGFMSSGRVQNLEWKCGEIWEAIKGMEGVKELYAPFMIEGDGMSYSND